MISVILCQRHCDIPLEFMLLYFNFVVYCVTYSRSAENFNCQRTCVYNTVVFKISTVHCDMRKKMKTAILGTGKLQEF
jgi:hypothetical protein